MVLHQRNLLIVYGGEYQGQTLNDLYVYRSENKYWITIDESSYDLRIPCRMRPALCSQGDYIYLFGG